MASQCADVALQRPDSASPMSDRPSVSREAAVRACAGRPGLLSDHPRWGKATRFMVPARSESATHRRGAQFMSAQYVADALHRVDTVLRRRPDMGLHDDSPAMATWRGNTRIVTGNGKGIEISTDMPSELGGTGDQVTPGWLLRAALAACTATRIAMGAAAAGIELTKLELRASSRSDTRGLLGMNESDGTRVGAGPQDVQLH